MLELEDIDDDTSKNGIPFVKISDIEVASAYGIGELPALVYFEKKIPNFYQGKRVVFIWESQGSKCFSYAFEKKK